MYNFNNPIDYSNLKNYYEKQIESYQNELARLNGGNIQMPYQSPYSTYPSQPQPPIQQTAPSQGVYPQPDLYLQSMYMKFLRSPEMQSFANDFYVKFAQFYKNETGVDFPYPNNMNNNINNMNNNMGNASNMNNNIVAQQPFDASKLTQQSNYIIERK